MRNWVYLLAIVGVLLVLDQVSKRLVVDNLLLYESHQPIPALSPFFQITRTENSGSAFGFLPQAGDIFLIIAIIVSLAMVYFYPRIEDDNWLLKTASGLVVAGALGNALDRLQYGLVIDFIHYQIPALGLSNVSNIADHAIVLGVILVLVDSWRGDRAKEGNSPPAEDEPESA